MGGHGGDGDLDTNVIRKKGRCRDNRIANSDVEPICTEGSFISIERDYTIVVVDEFGNTGPSHPQETKFGFGVSIVGDASKFKRISMDLRDFYHVSEYKASKAQMVERIEVANKIRDSGTTTKACYINKNGDHPVGMDSRDDYKRIQGMLGFTLDHVLPHKGNFFVIVDYHSQYRSSKVVEDICKRRTNASRNVMGVMKNSVGDGSASDYIQTNDFVSNAARSDIELGLDERSHILGITKIRAKGNDVFDEEDMK